MKKDPALETEVQEKKTKKTRTKKASTGAWWKSAAIEETPVAAVEEQPAPAVDSPRQAPASVASAVPSVSATAVAEKASETVTVEEKAVQEPEKVVPAKRGRRPGRKKKEAVAASVEKSVSAEEKEAMVQSPQEKKQEVSEADAKTSAVSAEVPDATGSTDIPEIPKPRKRPARKRKPKKDDTTESTVTADTNILAVATSPAEGKDAGPGQDDTAAVQNVNTAPDDEKTVALKKRPSRGGRRGKKNTAVKVEQSADSSASVKPEKSDAVQAEGPGEDGTPLLVTDSQQSPVPSDKKEARKDNEVAAGEAGSSEEQGAAESEVPSSGSAKENVPVSLSSSEIEKEQESGAPKTRSAKRKRGRKKTAAAAEAATVASADTESKDAALEGGWEIFIEKAPDSEGTHDVAVDSDEDEDDDDSDDIILEDDDNSADEKRPKPVIKLLINAEEPEECRLALLEDGRLESIHVATSTRTQTKNNIYKGKIVAIEPNLQAAFVEYGTEKNGFLPFAEIHPEYYKEDVSDKVRGYIEQHQWKRLSITDVMEKGCELLVQVVKEEVGKKGANMTTYLSLPGRCVVLMPGSDSTGVSRKISGEEKRAQLREYIQALDIPEGIGWIIRTASNDITQEALTRDVNYLLKLWSDIKKRAQDMDGVGLVYQDHDHVLRFLREHFDPDIEEILVDSEEALAQVKEFVAMLPQKQQNVRCKLHRGSRPIFNLYSIEDQIESIYQPKVNLPSGGSIVIDPTEALVAIDVNSGSTQKGANFEETIFQANMEAANELARQLRLRDLGGLVVVDFIDMRLKKNIREVERCVKLAMKRDKAKVDISRISKFGLMQISRQKLGAPIEAGNYRVCEHCKGRGVVRSVETLALFYLRRIHTGASRKNVVRIECRFPLDVAQYLLNNKRSELRELEERHGSSVIITSDPMLRPADNEIVFHKIEKDDSGKKRA